MSDELIDGGWSPKDAGQLAPLLVAEGVEFLFAIPATFETLRLPAKPSGSTGRLRYGVGDAAVFKHAVDVPVVANGRLGTPSTRSVC